MAEDMGEKTEQPTARRRSDARNQGQVAKSIDLSAALDLGGATLVLAMLGGGLLMGLGDMLRRALQDQSAGGVVTIDSVKPALLWAMSAGARVLLPMLGLVFVVAAAAQFMQVGWLFTTKPLQPKFDKLNPAAGARKLLNKRNAVKVAVNSVKMLVIVLVAWLVLRGEVAKIMSLPLMEMRGAFYAMGRVVLNLALWLLAVLLVIGIIDWTYQRWQQTQDLKMTKQEVKDERRSMEGDPEIKARRFRMGMEIAMQRLQRSVPEADVIVTNPTHFSVAIKYDQGTMRAPRVTAKGADFLAFRIRHLAMMNGVPIVERPPLARALFFGVEEGQEVHPEHYQAVAEVLAYVYRMEGQAA
jgi:flagellar biosynthetic protein FlhB